MDMIWYRRRGLMVTPHIESVTGAIASFNSDYNKIPIKSLICDIKPIQEGSGDPSPENVRPISGRTGVIVSHSGADTSDPSTISVNWESEAGTVYGGYVDVVSGKLVVTHICEEVTASMSWSTYTAGGKNIHRIIVDSLKISGHQLDYSCSHFKKKPTTGQATELGQIASLPWNSYNLEFILEAETTKAEFMQYLTDQANAGTPVQLWRYIGTPTEIQLNSKVVKTLLDENKIWCDSGNVSVDYWKWGK